MDEFNVQKQALEELKEEAELAAVNKAKDIIRLIASKQRQIADLNVEIGKRKEELAALKVEDIPAL